MKIIQTSSNQMKSLRSDRRKFIQNLGAMGLLAGIAPLNSAAKLIAHNSAEKVLTDKDTLSLQLYKSLTEKQKHKICLPLDNYRRSIASNFWYIHDEHRINNTFTADQADLIRQIFVSMHSDEFKETSMNQVTYDNFDAGFNDCSVGFFGSPSDDDFEFIFTGHHVTRRCNGHSHSGSGFGGPVFYGHQPNISDEYFKATAKNLSKYPGPIYKHHSAYMNEFFRSLDGRQQDQTFCRCSPPNEFERGAFQLKKSGFIGLPGSELSNDQKELLFVSMEKMLDIFRPNDVAETMKILRKSNRIDEMHVSFFAGNHDLHDDEFWDVWQIESPNMVWYFRGENHIHSYVNIQDNPRYL